MDAAQSIVLVLRQIKGMTQVKNGAATDVATFSNQKALSKTKAILNQVVADLYTAHIAFHQVHWYMRGTGFIV